MQFVCIVSLHLVLWLTRSHSLCRRKIQHNLYGHYTFPAGYIIRIMCILYIYTYVIGCTEHIIYIVTTLYVFNKHCMYLYTMKRETVSALKIFVGNTRYYTFHFSKYATHKMITDCVCLHFHIITAFVHHITFKRNAKALENVRPAWSDTDNNNKKKSHTLYILLLYSVSKHT